jgi:hypothetical protein
LLLSLNHFVPSRICSHHTQKNKLAFKPAQWPLKYLLSCSSNYKPWYLTHWHRLLKQCLKPPHPVWSVLSEAQHSDVEPRTK